MRGRSRATLNLEEVIYEIAAERQPLTVRGIAYALFVRDLIAAMGVNDTQKVSRITVKMREAGTLPWEWIVDDSRRPRQAGTWRNPSEIIHSAVASYRCDNWQDQDTIVQVWSEKSTVEGVLTPVLDDFGVNFQVMKGFGSATALNQLAALSRRVVRKQNAIALYIGDWDPSGLFMSEIDLPRRLERYDGKWHLRRIALVERDLDGLPSFSVATKAKDPRFRWFVENHGRRGWELDAMNPNDLRARVRREIQRYIDKRVWEHSRKVEQGEIGSMHTFHETWKSLLGAK